jgi:hypothetical protein
MLRERLRDYERDAFTRRSKVAKEVETFGAKPTAKEFNGFCMAAKQNH